MGSMTTHLRVTHTIKGYPEGHPQASSSKAACQGWRSRRDMQTTNDRSQVDCLRCAKFGGFEPKAKPAAANPGGTCQVCFGVYRAQAHRRNTPGSGHTVAKHGFSRPGDGYLHGECLGQGYEPFEKSKDRTVWFRAHLETLLARENTHIADLDGGMVESFQLEVSTTERNPRYGDGTFRGRDRYLTRTLTIRRGDQAQHGVEGLRNSVPSFDQVLERKRTEAVSRARGLKQHIGEVDIMLKDWAVKELLP